MLKIILDNHTSKLSQKVGEMLDWNIQNLGETDLFYQTFWAVMEVYRANHQKVWNFNFKENNNLIKVEVNNDEFYIRRTAIRIES